jgi:hypothetical protein
MGHRGCVTTDWDTGAADTPPSSSGQPGLDNDSLFEGVLLIAQTQLSQLPQRPKTFH